MYAFEVFESFTTKTATRSWLTALALLTLLGVTLLVYWPGLNGPLLLDDIPNLSPLGTIGPIHNATDFFVFVLDRSTYYPQRPLSYASFLINDLGWPLYIWMHKYTNLLIHLLNGVLVFWLAFLLGQSTRLSLDQRIYVAFTTSALWLLAPLQVSTVLYVIQRMTELSALFVLCGVISYCYARQRLNTNPLRSVTQMTAGIMLFGTLGFLSKENAILLTLYILTIEYTIFRVHDPVSQNTIKLYFRIWKSLVLVAPVLLTFSFLVYRGAFQTYEFRPFTAFEGVVSQPRILFDYLQKLLVPSREGLGLAHDDFVLSTDWISPPTTIVAILALLVLFVSALYVSRNRTSIISLAILWFLAGHLLESSLLALERYWEHRNYLPSFGPLFAVSYYGWTVRLRLYKFLRVALVAYLAMFALITSQNALIWSSYATIAETWAADHPDSLRAQQMLADYWSRQGYHRKADQIMRRIAEKQPDSMGAQLEVLLTTCRYDGDEVRTTLAKIEPLIADAHYDHSVVNSIRILMGMHERACPRLTFDDILALTNTILENETVQRRKRIVTVLLALKAAFLSKKGYAQEVVSHLYAAFDERPSHSLGLIAIEYLYEIGQYDVALQVLNETMKLKTSTWDTERFKIKHLEKWRSRIENKLKEESTADKSETQ